MPSGKRDVGHFHPADIITSLSELAGAVQPYRAEDNAEQKALQERWRDWINDRFVRWLGVGAAHRRHRLLYAHRFDRIVSILPQLRG